MRSRQKMEKSRLKKMAERERVEKEEKNPLQKAELLKALNEEIKELDRQIEKLEKEEKKEQKKKKKKSKKKKAEKKKGKGAGKVPGGSPLADGSSESVEADEKKKKKKKKKKKNKTKKEKMEFGRGVASLLEVKGGKVQMKAWEEVAKAYGWVAAGSKVKVDRVTDHIERNVSSKAPLYANVDGVSRALEAAGPVDPLTVTLALEALPETLRKALGWQKTDSLAEWRDRVNVGLRSESEQLGSDAAGAWVREKNEKWAEAVRRIGVASRMHVRLERVDERNVVRILQSERFLGKKYMADNSALVAHVRNQGIKKIKKLATAVEEAVRLYGERAEGAGGESVVLATLEGPEHTGAPPLAGQPAAPPGAALKECFNCKRQGHMKAWCPELSEEERKKLQEKWQQGRNKGQKSPYHAVRVGDDAGAEVTMPVTEETEFEDVEVTLAASTMEVELLVKAADSGVEHEFEKGRVSLDTVCERDIVREDALPKGAVVRPAAKVLRGAGGTSRVRGVTVARLGVQGFDGEVKTVEMEWLVADSKFPRPWVLSFSSMRRMRWAYDSDRGDKVRLMGTDVPLLEGGGALAMVVELEEFVALPTLGQHALERMEEEVADGAPTRPLKDVVGQGVEEGEGAEAEAEAEAEYQVDDFDASGIPTAGEESAQERKERLMLLRECAHKEGTALSEEGKVALEGLLVEYENVFRHDRLFASDAAVREQEVAIPLKEDAQLPIEQPRLPRNPELRRALDAKHEAFERAGFIRPVGENETVMAMSNTWAIPKQPRSWTPNCGEPLLDVRVVYGLVALNKCVIKDHYGVADPKAFLDVCYGVGLKAQVDEKDSYFNHRLRKQDQLLFCFPTTKGVYCWVVMPQGYCNAPAELAKYKFTMLRDFTRQQLVFSFDDTLLLNKVQGSEKEFLELVERFLRVCSKQKNFLSIKKCFFGFETVKWQGFLLGRQECKKDPMAVAPIRALELPEKREGLTKFLGMVQHYHDWDAGMAQKALPLTEMLRKEANWAVYPQEEHVRAHEELREALASSTELRLPNYSREFHVAVDSSPKDGVAGCIAQLNEEGEMRPIMFMSRRPSAAEKKMWASEMELRGLRWVVCEKGGPMLRGSRVVAHVDGQSVELLHKRRGWLAAQTLKKIVFDLRALMEYDLELTWEPRASPNVSSMDYLQRCQEEEEELQPEQREAVTPLLYEVMATMVEEAGLEKAMTQVEAVHCVDVLVSELLPGELVDIDEEQRKDPLLRAVAWGIKDRTRLSGANEEFKEMVAKLPRVARERLRSYRDKDPKLEKFFMEDGRLFQRDAVGVGAVSVAPKREYTRTALPHSLLERVLSTFHTSVWGGHFGRKATLLELQKRFFVVGMSKAVRNFVRACMDCMKRKRGMVIHKGLKPIYYLRPFSVVQFDFMIPTVQSKRGYKYVLSIVCPSSGKTKSIPQMSRSGLETAKSLLLYVVLGEAVVPLQWHSDNAPEFIGGLVKALATLMGIRSVAGTPYKPSVQGAVERRNVTKANMLAMMSNSEQDDWDINLPWVDYGINNHVFSATGVTPNYYCSGYEAVGPFALQEAGRLKVLEKMPKKFGAGKVMLSEAMGNMDIARAWAAQNQSLSKEAMAERFDGEHQQASKVQVGDTVLVFWPRMTKLSFQWHGPYVVKELLADGRSARVAQLQDEADTFNVHVDRLSRVDEVDEKEWVVFKSKEWQDFMQDPGKISVAEWDAQPEEAQVQLQEFEELGKDEYEVEFIVGHRDRKVKVGKKKKLVLVREYKVRWLGYPPSEDSWVAEEELLESSNKLVVEYLEKIGEVTE